MSYSGWVHLNVRVIARETEKAFKVFLEDGGEPLWLPKSQVADAENYNAGDRDCVVSITEWFANEKGLSSDD